MSLLSPSCSLVKDFLPGTSLEPAAIHRSGFKFHTPVLPVLCVMFQVYASFVVNLLNVFLVWLSKLSLSLLLPFRWLQLLPVQSYVSCATFIVSLYIKSHILASLLLPFARHFCPQVLPHTSVCVFSLFWF